jgi:hypothetical protein
LAPKIRGFGNKSLVDQTRVDRLTRPARPRHASVPLPGGVASTERELQMIAHLGEQDEFVGRLAPYPVASRGPPGHATDRSASARQLVPARSCRAPPPQTRCEREPPRRVPVERGVVDRRVQALALRLVHRDVGVAHQRRGVEAVRRRDRRADRGVDPELEHPDLERRAQARDHLVRHRQRGPRVAAAADENGELVAAQPRELTAARGEQRREPRADQLEELVAGEVPERVVDLLEVVEVHHHQRRPSPVLRHTSSAALLSASHLQFGSPMRGVAA